MRVFENVTELIGHTPLIRLRTGIPENGPDAFVKLEAYNPTGSVKDRMAYYIVKKALDEGRLKPGDTVIDNTSGNTGSALAMTASVLGLKAILTTPEKTSQEKIDLIKSYGAEVIVTPSDLDHEDPDGCFMLARILAEKNGYFDLNQYHNPENIDAHYYLTGPEIWDDTEGLITHFVCGIGTGGTFSGIARFLKEKNPGIKTIAVDPEGSVLKEFIEHRREIQGHAYKVEGIGSDVITRALDPDVVDEVITVSDNDSFHRARLITKKEGISAGGSSGSVAFAMEQVARRVSSKSIIVGIFADAAIRYLSKCYNDTWMKKQGYMPVLDLETK